MATKRKRNNRIATAWRVLVAPVAVVHTVNKKGVNAYGFGHTTIPEAHDLLRALRQTTAGVAEATINEIERQSNAK